MRLNPLPKITQSGSRLMLGDSTAHAFHYYYNYILQKLQQSFWEILILYERDKKRDDLFLYGL